MYTNADSFLNKIDELKNVISIREKRPLIIAVTEVKPKNWRYAIALAEVKLDEGYESFYCNLDNKEGRGVLLYVDKRLSPSPWRNQYIDEFQESV